MKYVITFILGALVAAGATYLLMNKPTVTPVASTLGTTELQTDLKLALETQELLKDKLTKAEEQINALLAEAAEKKLAMETETAADPETEEEEAAEDGEETEKDRKKSMEEILAEIKDNPMASAQIQAMTELAYADFLNSIELDPDTKAKLRALLNESFMETAALNQYAMQDGEATWKELAEWKAEERDFLNQQLQALLPEDAQTAWSEYSADIDAHTLDGILRNQIKAFASGLTTENFESVVQVAVEEFRAEQLALENSDTLYNSVENIYYQLRALAAMRERLQNFLNAEQFAEINNFLTMGENVLNSQLPDNGEE